VKVELGGVPETLLWTLYQRSIEARRPDAILADPRAVALVDELDYPFAERFGGGEGYEELRLPRGRGPVFGLLAPLADSVAPLRRLFFTIQRRRL
jgi:O-methyltransferase involved in polyketide biosynthesis